MPVSTFKENPGKGNPGNPVSGVCTPSLAFESMAVYFKPPETDHGLEELEDITLARLKHLQHLFEAENGVDPQSMQLSLRGAQDVASHFILQLAFVRGSMDLCWLEDAETRLFLERIKHASCLEVTGVVQDCGLPFEIVAMDEPCPPAAMEAVLAPVCAHLARSHPQGRQLRNDAPHAQAPSPRTTPAVHAVHAQPTVALPSAQEPGIKPCGNLPGVYAY
jgi:hypothetical protein